MKVNHNLKPIHDLNIQPQRTTKLNSTMTRTATIAHDAIGQNPYFTELFAFAHEHYETLVSRFFRLKTCLPIVYCLRKR